MNFASVVSYVNAAHQREHAERRAGRPAMTAVFRNGYFRGE